jgi:hypothetical protein
MGFGRISLQLNQPGATLNGLVPVILLGGFLKSAFFGALKDRPMRGAAPFNEGNQST